MALVRCEKCGVKLPGRGHYKRTYVQHVLPVGHPNSAVVCGKPACLQPGVIWLEEPEAKAYAKGQQIFYLQTNTTKVRAQ